MKNKTGSSFVLMIAITIVIVVLVGLLFYHAFSEETRQQDCFFRLAKEKCGGAVVTKQDVVSFTNGEPIYAWGYTCATDYPSHSRFHKFTENELIGCDFKK